MYKGELMATRIFWMASRRNTASTSSACWRRWMILPMTASPSPSSSFISALVAAVDAVRLTVDVGGNALGIAGEDAEAEELLVPGPAALRAVEAVGEPGEGLAEGGGDRLLDLRV